MAYGNWGAFVYRNDERQESHEDNTPYKETEFTAGYWQAFLIGKDGIRCHHAVCGDMDLRLCGYKCYPVLFNKGEEIPLNQFFDGELEKIGDSEYLPDYYVMVQYPIS